MTILKIFGVALGVASMAYGFFASLGGVNGIGPCRVSCGFDSAMRSLFGPVAYGRLYGGLWMCGGRSVCVVYCVQGGPLEGAVKGDHGHYGYNDGGQQ